MKQIGLIIVLSLSWMGFSQERISPLQTNPSIYNGKSNLIKAGNGGIDSTFIYELDTLDLPFFDDFSTNKFEQYNADYSDPGVTDEWFFELMNETNTVALAPDVALCDSLRSKHDTVVIAGGLSTVVTHYPFDEVTVWENDLDFYPVVGQVRTLFEECYVVIDSVIDGVLDADQDTIFYEASFTQDSVNVFTKTITDDGRVWVDNHVYHNYTFAVDPWSLGVATFDGVDANGFPYQFGVESSHGVADYLTSKPIDLSSPDGLVKLTFLYQAQGFGNLPEEEDSLLLEVWDVDNAEWKRTMWYATTADVEPNQWDTATYFVEVDYLRDGFQFRLKNYASLSGALDHWHIDYVNIEDNGLPGPDNVSDLAISYPLNTLLKDYTSVPWDHYKVTTGAEKMLDRSTLFVYNSDLTATNFSNGQFESRYGGVLQGGSPFVIPSTGDVGSPNYTQGMNNCYFEVDGDYSYDQTVAVEKAEFDIKVSVAADVAVSNQYDVNDTTYLTQRFSNYYAYDDGSAEAAYGVEGSGSLMAYKFDSYQAGELTGILMHFVPSVTDFDEEIFLLTVWADNGGQPGEIIYQDDFFESHTPDYTGAREGFKYYEFYNDEFLTDGYLPVGETFYVGWQNVNSYSLNVGLDWNINNGDKVYRNTTGSWLTSSYDISLLIRPVFSTALDYTLSNARDIDEAVVNSISVYPNPANNNFTISGLEQKAQINVFDMSGRLVVQTENQKTINISELEKGVYLIDVRSLQGEKLYSTKLIKQ